ncbi:threonine dehydratase [Streptosporangium becharense]|uniref:Threonine dehydratase n=1 Tax=Streptosporangium becharense TaxID=1816182 RepID=A0A7W9MFL0_9ACTN|nr:threonine/serine dehydratase [Streptosporangium becharense]MBB2911957.1 threonine dehydratase [Streptosporangium becharense]MBB5818504.1 threonine dehydratase [Streptosporangium becharense]
MSVSIGDVERAAARIAGRVRRTPVLEVSPGLFLKLEGTQHAGSFKTRGGFNRALSAGRLPETGLIAASGGNHGLAVAYVARSLGVRAEIFVPTVASPVKVEGLRALGAVVTQTGAVYAEAYEASAKRAGETGALDVHAYDQAEVVAGQGTVGLEVLEQTGGVDTVLVAVGGGGLIAGIVAAVAGRARVVAVEPELIPTMHRALAAGGPVGVEVGGVAADALGASRLGDIAYEIAGAADVHSVLVPDEAIVEARRELWRTCRVAAEYAGATAYAALMTGAYTPAPGERVAVVVCGANTDPATLV